MIIKPPQAPVAYAWLAFEYSAKQASEALIESVVRRYLVQRIQIELCANSCDPEFNNAIYNGVSAQFINTNYPPVSDTILFSLRNMEPASKCSVLGIWAFDSFTSTPILALGWGSCRRERDIHCRDVVNEVSYFVSETNCKWAVLGAECSVLLQGGTLSIPTDICEIAWLGKKIIPITPATIDEVRQFLSDPPSINGYPVIPE